MAMEIYKPFSDLAQLKSDGTNYSIWSDRVAVIAEGCGVGDMLTQTTDPAKDKEHGVLCAAILGKVPDAIFQIVRSHKEPFELMKALKS